MQARGTDPEGLHHAPKPRLGCISTHADHHTTRRGPEGPADPISFVEETLGEEPYEKQTDILSAVARSRRVSVVGCHGSGKDWAAARAVLWWLHSRSPAKAIVTGPTTRQVDDILWREIRTAHAHAAHRLRGRVFRTSRYEIDDQTFAIGFSTSSPYNLQGFHSPNLMVVVTEAHAVPGTDIDALRRLNPALTLMTGNPLVAAGPFYDSHHSKRAMYDTVRIGAGDIPNLTRLAVPGMVAPEHVADRKAEWGRSDAMYVGGVLGRFPDNLDDAVVTLRDATDAAERSLQPAGDIVVACDVSRFGQAKTVVVRRQGPVARIVWRVRGRDTMSIAEFLESYCDRERVDTLVVDDSGVGGGGRRQAPAAPTPPHQARAIRRRQEGQELRPLRKPDHRGLVRHEEEVRRGNARHRRRPRPHRAGVEPNVPPAARRCHSAREQGRQARFARRGRRPRHDLRGRHRRLQDMGLRRRARSLTGHSGRVVPYDGRISRFRGVPQS